ncbi:DUF2169 family type VI secretion system accessory protein [Rhizobium leguminosarum]|uniref:DUF2169 family type VI secretion system accessory protein n=1 Tax=Rhizobium leguminosarum TaxID=384 RepID=UPI003F9881EB
MWKIDNRTPFAAMGYFVRDKGGLEHWVMAVRARFAIIENGFSRISENQGDIRLSPEYADDRAEELISESDFSPFRPRVDFLVDGEITAPEERSVNKVHVGFELAGYTKRAVAFGARRLRMQGDALKLDGYEMFSPCRLSWRNSLGGPDLIDPDGPAHSANPIGKGWTAKWPRLLSGSEIELPLVENPDKPIGEGALPDPIGFGSLQPVWMPRAGHAGTYDDDWRKYEAPLLPADFSADFFQAAPEDQIFDLKGGETVRMFGLHPSGEYQFRLPQVIIESTTWMGRDRIEARPRLISVSVNGTEKTLEMVWNVAIPCEAGDMAVSKSRIHVKQMAGVFS